MVKFTRGEMIPVPQNMKIANKSGILIQELITRKWGAAQSTKPKSQTKYWEK